MLRSLLLVVAAGLVGCARHPGVGGGPPDRPTEAVRDPSAPPIKLTAEALAGAYQADRAAAIQKYGGRVLEVTGTLSSTNPWGGFVTLHGVAKDSVNVDCKFTDAEAEREQGLSALSRAQAVTVRGVFVSRGPCKLEGGELLTVGPSTARPVTLAALAEDLKDGGMMAGGGADVLVRVQVVERVQDAEAVWVVCDPDDPDGVYCRLTPPAAMGASFDALEQAGPGAVLLVLANAPLGNLRLDSARVLSEPPAGVPAPMPSEKEQ